MSFNYSTLSDVAEVVDSLHKTPSYSDQGFPMVRVTDVRYGELPLGGCLKVDEQTFIEFSRRYKPSQGDIVITRVGTYGVTARVVKTEFCLGQNTAAIIPRAINGRYLYAALNSSLLRAQIEGSAVGSTQKTLSLKCINALQIPRLGELAESEIAKLIGTLDDRIALLRETNATLEAIAQALFKSWFVDFDPVRAKMAGCAPEGMGEATAALFPDRLTDSPLGLVPEGWRVGELGEVMALRNDRTQPSAQTKSLPYVPIESIGAKTPFLSEHKSGDEANSSLVLFKQGDILFGAMRPYFHKVCIAPFDGVTRTTVFTLQARNEQAKGFALLVAYQDSTIEYATQHSEGSTIPYAKWKGSLERMPVLIPPQSVQELFSGVVSSLIDKANLNNQKAQTLAALRDTLLPRLISGQLRLPEATSVLEPTL